MPVAFCLNQSACCGRRLRISLSAAHSEADVDSLVAALKDAGVVAAGAARPAAADACAPGDCRRREPEGGTVRARL